MNLEIERRKLRESLDLFVKGCEEGNLFEGDPECICMEIKNVVKDMEFGR